MRPDTAADRSDRRPAWEPSIPAVLALGDGPADVLLHGETVFHTVLHGGFASVRDNVIRVITDSDIETDKERDIENED